MIALLSSLPPYLVELVLELHPVQTQRVEETLEHVHTQNDRKGHTRKDSKADKDTNDGATLNLALDGLLKEDLEGGEGRREGGRGKGETRKTCKLKRMTLLTNHFISFTSLPPCLPSTAASAPTTRPIVANKTPCPLPP